MPHMGVIVVATTIGFLAFALVAVIVAFSAIALTGLKVVNAAHDGRSWCVNRIQQRSGR